MKLLDEVLALEGAAKQSFILAGRS